MQFKNVRIENFRGISSLKIEGLGKINLLVGQNNCGKTSVLEALFLLTGISVPQLAFNINSFRGYNREADESNLRLIFKNLNFDQAVQLSAEFDQEGYRRRMSIKPHNKNEVNGDSKKVATLSDVESNLSISQRPVVDGLTVDFNIDERQDREYSESRSSSFTFGSYSSAFLFAPGGGGQIYSPPNYNEIFGSVFLSPSTQFQGLGESLERLLVEKQEEKLVKILQKVDRTIEDISLGANGIVYLDIGLKRLVPVNVMGDGVRRMLSIIVAIADVKGGMVFIDEIDNGFHYSILRELWNAIMEAAHQYEVQVFATSHSEECIRALAASYYDRPSLFNDTSVRLFRVEKHDKEHRAVAYDHEILETSLELNLGIR